MFDRIKIPKETTKETAKDLGHLGLQEYYSQKQLKENEELIIQESINESNSEIDLPKQPTKPDWVLIPNGIKQDPREDLEFFDWDNILVEYLKYI